MKNSSWALCFILSGLIGVLVAFQSCGSIDNITGGLNRSNDENNNFDPIIVLDDGPGRDQNLDKSNFEDSNFSVEIRCSNSSNRHILEVRYGRDKDRREIVYLSSSNSLSLVAQWDRNNLVTPINLPISDKILIESIEFDNNKVFVSYRQTGQSSQTESLDCL